MEVIKSLDELTPKAKKACELFLFACESAGYDIFITETYRSQERQDYLYSQGRTRPGQIVTWTRQSRHTSRRAWDIAVAGPELYNTKVLKECGEIGKSLGLIWGGDWNPPDMPHYEVSKDWGDILEKRYNTLEEVPSWAREDVKKIIDLGGFADPELYLTSPIFRS